MNNLLLRNLIVTTLIKTQLSF